MTSSIPTDRPDGAGGVAELRVLSALVMKPALEALAGDLSRAAGGHPTICYDAAGALRDRIRAGETFDVAILQRPALEALARDGRIVPASIVTLARSGLAVAVRAGAPKPPLDGADGVRRALLAAGSIAYPDPALGHASGIQFVRVAERLGIAAALAAKARLMEGALADFAARNEADIAVTQPMEILAAPGYELAGWLPRELQDEEGFTWAIGMGGGAVAPQAARALIRCLRSPEAARVIGAKGMVPEGR